MKKSLLTLCFALAVCLAKATIYYQPYPITVTQTSNGTDFRLECSVYDSSLATTQTFNTAYYETFTNSASVDGIVIFDANNANNTGEYFIGCITYDFEIHQWKTHTVTSFDPSSYTTFISNYVRFYSQDFILERENLEVCYYDIVSHNWIVSSLTGESSGCNSVGVDENILLHSSGFCVDNDYDYYVFNPAAHQWTYMTTVSPSPTDFSNDGLAGAYMDFDPFNGDPPFMDVATLDPAAGGASVLTFGFYDISDYTVNSGIYCQRNSLNSEVEYGKYDAQQHMWKIAAFPTADISSWKCNGGVLSFVNGTSSMIINAVYNFNLHQWVYDSVPTPSVSAHAITNGTVTWNNGSGTVTRGYNAVGGWGNSTTLPQAVFYTANLSSTGAGNLVYLRNYSIGATTWSYDFGDGIVSTERNVFHLYKIGGSYLYSGSSPSANICLTVTSPAGNNSSCQSIGCTTPVAAITAGGPTSFCTGGSVTLNVGTSAGYTYQWQLNNGDITGETNTSYVANAAGSYTCVVTNACGTATSNAISVTINAGPTAAITAGGPTSFCTGGNVTLNANTGAGLSWQWQLNNADITGETNSSYVANAAGSYTCIVTNTCGTATSNAISVTINAGPTAAITAGGATTFCTGGSVTLNVGTSAGYTYQWQLNNGDITGETNTSYVANAAGSYTCIVTNACGTATSNAISVTVNAGPTAAITAGGPTSFCTGGSVTLNANTGAGLSWQWQLNNADITGETNSSYVATASGNYTCNVTNSCGTVSSNAITVTVNTGTVAVITNLTGVTYMCPGNTYNYSVTNISGATFNWTVPANVTVSSGQGTNAVILSVGTGFSSGSVCVNATNGCSTSLSKCRGVATTAPGRPTGISGVLNGVCAATQSYTAAAVASATGYTWSVVGGTLLTGQGTQTVSVQWNGTGTSGTLNVTADNSCGSSLVRSVGVTFKPEVAAAISGPATLCAGSTNNIFTIPSAAGASSYFWQITPSGSTIVSGQSTTSINATWGTSSGTVLCTPSNACGSSQTKKLTVTVNCRIGNSGDVTSNESGLMELNAYPNPFNDKINIQLNSSDDATVLIKITDVAGRIISQQSVNANSVYTMGETMSNGIYFVEARQNDSIKTIRVVKSK